jgi:isoleucyl-tRNA synthetase
VQFTWILSKDRAYVEGKNSMLRRSAQTVMNEILNALMRLLAPILAFTADEIWAYVPGQMLKQYSD